jgi:hypothetical protein
METTEELCCKSEWARMGFVPKAGENPREIKRRWGGGEIHLYAREQVRPKRPQRRVPPHPIDLLAAIFAVTRSAKRYRDAATQCYQQGAYALATANRRAKQNCYILKDMGIAAALRAGRIAAVATHGPLTVYRGEGYCYHSLLRPKGFVSATDGEQEPLTVEAKPRDTAEPRLCDALVTLSSLPAVDSKAFEVHRFPPRSRGDDRSDDGGPDDWQRMDEDDEDDGYVGDEVY